MAKWRTEWDASTGRHRIWKDGDLLADITPQMADAGRMCTIAVNDLWDMAQRCEVLDNMCKALIAIGPLGEALVNASHLVQHDGLEDANAELSESLRDFSCDEQSDKKNSNPAS